MAPHPTSQTKADRTETWRMIDAFRKVEADLHHRLLELRTIPSEWDGIHERRAERAPRREKVTANFDADVVRFFKGLGPGYQWRMNEVLRAYVHGRMAKIVKGPDTTDYILHPERIPEEPEPWEWGQAEASLVRKPPTDAKQAKAEAERKERMAASYAHIDARAQARFAEWKAKAAEADAKGEPRPPLF